MLNVFFTTWDVDCRVTKLDTAAAKRFDANHCPVEMPNLHKEFFRSVDVDPRKMRHHLLICGTGIPLRESRQAVQVAPNRIRNENCQPFRMLPFICPYNALTSLVTYGEPSALSRRFADFPLAWTWATDERTIREIPRLGFISTLPCVKRSPFKLSSILLRSAS